ncbi:CRISPR-associated endonuclease/helicase Cas3 [Andreprevotia lacus DSM 23236]|uniref:CRISPR-associated endonuclease/helicase Cas3 n=1 Tax=Andreprevotia lacus DSM 23236 TaxID=1121001 RepID=A0A1W1X328_9NEIS|nr:type I-F CRISPR-associated helicase Cas3f [Andreprevotia lacus]SMC17811.1 CRISPR-associated endonuclease/helicase Cas3 [Andreprevotia lacus DSM 23236]
MQILLISECSKQALTETRRVIDQFAERMGRRTWQTAITNDGLLMLRKLLRRTARKNTAVACHWIKTNGQTELLWLVGNARRFNDQGRVPTNTTRQSIITNRHESSWQTAEVIALLASIAGLFHDFGKANRLFQRKLQPGAAKHHEPLRHEWVSLCLFAAFVDQQDDAAWLLRLANAAPGDETLLLNALARMPLAHRQGPGPLSQLHGLARAIGWLIVTHHKLPASHPHHAKPDLEKACIEGGRFDAGWISPQSCDAGWTTQDWADIWCFDHGTPLRSHSWCAKARQIGSRALKAPHLANKDWLQEDPFSVHLARMSLMLADHSYSAGPAQAKWQDAAYQAWANTAIDKDTGQRHLKQKLDEHNAGVGHNALLLARRLPQLQRQLPAISRHRELKKRTTAAAYQWQNKAFDLARQLAQPARQQGFFGINMASTGCGKTFANARIMYGLADEQRGCRFSVALGLRTLTLQTGDALRQRLQLDSDELAVLIGSQAVLALHELNKTEQGADTSAAASGSESGAALIDDSQHVYYDGTLDDGPLQHWLKQSGKLHELLSAPVLVSTIDHLIPATEGTRGGQQIAPMLRLLTADLVLDEPDDFDISDLPALCRLVHWAGMLGARVLLSSATLPPALVAALFEAYQHGRRHYDKACGNGQPDLGVCCAWFDEFGCTSAMAAERAAFRTAHDQFVAKRVSTLAKQPPLRLGQLLPIGMPAGKRDREVFQTVAQALHPAIWQLHRQHHDIAPGSDKTLSLGLIRMANINPLVAVSQLLLQIPPPDDCQLHFCVYHSQYPLIVRSHIEARLDTTLNRRDPASLWQIPEIHTALTTHAATHHAFIVLATSVAEVGRDHDYSWAIAEPSSMRSLIQLAGRIQRHRQQQPTTPNLLIWSRSIKALLGEKLAYWQPGFESKSLQLKRHDLETILPAEHYQRISAKPRVQLPAKTNTETDLVGLEHLQLVYTLFGGKTGHEYEDCHAARWWQQQPGLHWCAEHQHRTRFRKSAPDVGYVLLLDDNGETLRFHERTDDGELLPRESEFQWADFSPAAGNRVWLAQDIMPLLNGVAERMDQSVSTICQRFTELRLDERKSTDTSRWSYHPALGVWKA